MCARCAASLPRDCEIWTAVSVGREPLASRGGDRLLFDNGDGGSGRSVRLGAGRRPSATWPQRSSPAASAPHNAARGAAARRFCDRRRLGGRRSARAQVAGQDRGLFDALRPACRAAAARMRLNGRFGRFGGCYVPEILVPALEQLEAAFLDAQDDPAFARRAQRTACELCRPADAADPLPQPARQHLSEARGPAPRRRAQDQPGARPGAAGEAHGQDAADRRDRRRPARRRDRDRRRAARLRDRHLHGCGGCRAAAAQRLPHAADGREVVPVESGGRTLKDAINEALRDWSASFENTHYLLGTAAGPHPFPTMVREFQRVIGREARAQIIEQIGRLPDAVVACVGGGSNAIGLFADFLDDDVRLIGVEAAGQGPRRRRAWRDLAARARPAFSTARRPMCSRTRTGRSPTPGRSPPGSIIPRSGPSTRI